MPPLLLPHHRNLQEAYRSDGRRKPPQWRKNARKTYKVPEISKTADPLALPRHYSQSGIRLSADPEQQHFTDGVTEELLNALVAIDGLRVISRSSSFAFRDRDQLKNDRGCTVSVSRGSLASPAEFCQPADAPDSHPCQLPSVLGPRRVPGAAQVSAPTGSRHWPHRSPKAGTTFCRPAAYGSVTVRKIRHAGGSS